MDYKEDLKIDKFSLDTEWERQALLFAKWAELAVEAAFNRDRAKENLDIVRATLDQKIRIKAAAENEKITESAILNKIILSPAYQEANQGVIEATKNLGILNVARESFEHKKKALERETDLFLSNYWSSPKITTETREKMESTNHESARKSMQDTMRKRREKTQ